MGLDPAVRQQDFSVGAFRAGALEREPDGAAETIVGLIGDDGLPYRRGGATDKSGSLGGAGLAGMWDGYLLPGRRTVLLSSAVGAPMGVLDVDDSTVITFTGPPAVRSNPVRPVELNGILYIPPDVKGGFAAEYGGTRSTAPYSTGTVSVSAGSTAVVGVGTAWTSAMVGMIFDTTGPHNVVQSVTDGTHLTLGRPWLGGALAGAAYALSPVVNRTQTDEFKMATVAGRLLALSGSRLKFSKVNDPTFNASDYHDFPSASEGIAVAVLRDTVLAFMSSGVWAISNMAYGLADPGTGDPQQRKELVNADLIAWGHEGIAPWAGQLVVPAVDNIWLMDSLGAPVSIGDRIIDLYLSYVRAGYKPGVAEVFNGHYLLPVLTSGNVWVDTLVCRLTPTHSDVRYGWSQLTGAGAEVSAFAERQTAPPLLLGASTRVTSRVLDCSPYFAPVSARKADVLNTTHNFDLTTTDYPTGGGVSNFVHSVEVEYQLEDAASDNPTFTVEASVDGGAWATLAGTGAETGTVGGEARFRVNRHARHVRFRIAMHAAAATFKVIGITAWVRHSGKR